MWVSRKEYKALHEQNTEIASLALRDVGHLQGVVAQLKAENERMRVERGWFMHRLNQVERERAMLIQDRIGVPISTPTFIPVADSKEDEALMQMPDLSTVGGDAHEDNGAPRTDADPGEGVDYSMLPGYSGKR